MKFKSKCCACVLTAVGEMPWKAFPFGDPRIDHLSQMYANFLSCCLQLIALSCIAPLPEECELISIIS